MLWIALLLVAAILDGGCAQPVVDTVYGPVSGRTRTIHTGAVVNAYYGIPFTKPPVGELRWMPPQDPEPWEDVFVATRLPDACPQGEQGLVWITHPGWGRYSEDCLSINIFTPNDTSTDPYPVMVWFHGGGYSGSANVQYPGHYIAGKDVILVVPNYRLGNLGFQTTESDVAPGNYGIMDQIKALEFVRDNIAAFGGDPNRVTIFGQSAGGSSSGIHIVSPKSEGLFHQAILESGTDMAPWAVNYPSQEPRNYFIEVAEKLACPTEDAQEMVDCLRELPFDDIRRTGFSCKDGHFCLGAAPVVDGDIIPDVPWKLRVAGEYAHVPMMNGHCKDDGSLYTVAFIPEAQEGGFNRTEFTRILYDNLVAMFAASFTPEETEQVYEALNFYYTPWPHIEDLEMNREAFNVMITDFSWSAPGDWMMKNHAEENDVYFYILGYRTSQADNIIPPWMGVPHNGELPYVFGWPLLKRDPLVRLDTGIVIDLISWDEEDEEWAEYVVDMWTNFAKYGNPTPEPVPAPGNNSDTTWDLFNVETQEYLYMDRDIENLQDYRQRNIALWEYYEMYLVGWRDSEIPTGPRNKAPKAPRKQRKGGEKLQSDMVMNRMNDFYVDMVNKRLVELGMAPL